MADVKWIKITTDIFDDEKILLIETLPDADAIIVIWFKLLCLAGKQNNNGVFLINNQIAYTDKILATIFRRKESTVQLALETFKQFGMIEFVEGVITIPNWGKHQNLDTIERNRNYMRDYMTKYREKQRNIACKANVKTNSKSNVSGADKNRIDKNRIDKEYIYTHSDKPSSSLPFSDLHENEDDTKEDIPPKDKKTVPVRHKHGEYQNVLLSDEEMKKLKAEFPDDWEKRIENLSEYIASSGKKYKNFLATIRKWSKNERKDVQPNAKTDNANDENLRELERQLRSAGTWL